MPHMTAMLFQGDAEALLKMASLEVSIFGRVAGALESESLEKQARGYGIGLPRMMSAQGSDGDIILGGDSPVVDFLRGYMRDHPPENAQALRDLYAQAAERALQVTLSKMETGDDADPMALALKNMQRMADLLESRLQTLRAQRDIQMFQQELAAQQGLSQENPATQAVAGLPAPMGAPPEGGLGAPAPAGAAPPAGIAPPAPPAPPAQ